MMRASTLKPGLASKHRLYKCYEPVDSKDNEASEHDRKARSDKKPLCWGWLVSY